MVTYIKWTTHIQHALSQFASHKQDETFLEFYIFQHVSIFFNFSLSSQSLLLHSNPTTPLHSYLCIVYDLQTFL